MDENSPDSFDSFDSFDATTIVPSRKRRPQRTILAPVTNDKDDEEPKSRKRKIDNQLIDKRRSPALHIHIGERTDTFSEILTSKIVDLQVHSNSLDEGQRVLRCTNEANETSHVYLQDQWVETPIFVGNTIRLFDAKLWNENDWLIDAEQGLIVVEPDTLISATSVAQALFCARKTVLNERFRGGGGTNKAMLMGSIIHELFQLALLLKCPVTSEWVLTTWRSLIEKNLSYLVALTSLNFTPAHFESELQPYLDVICDWINDKIGERKPLPSGFVFNALVDTEENIWVPILGLKGKLDATLKVQDSQGKTHLEPLELKTGKSAHSIEHNVQVLLYCMMLSIREKKPMYPGSLVYLKDGVSRSVELRKNDLKGAFQVRNRLASFSSCSSLLPEPITNIRLCNFCEQSLNCSLLTSNTQEPEYTTFTKQKTVHVSPLHKEYFEKWVNMITIEQRTSLSRGRKTSAIWKVPPEKREKWGTCISYLRLNECKKMANGKQEITFSRSKQISHVEISRGDFIIVSSKRCYAIITGSIVSINENSIVLISDHELLDEAQQNEFHLDRLESTSTHAINLSSVGFLMSDDLKRERLRNLVIDLIEPQFEKIPKSLIQKISPLISSLNKEQARAVVRALVAKDYALIEGLPGAGKSTTLSCIVRCFLELGQSVLITSYTHSAVDNLFEKFMEYVPEKDLLRIGNRYSVKDKVAHLTIDSKMENISDGRFDAMKGLLNNARVVGATCLSVSSHPMFSFRTFDVCLVDEASLALECSLLTPLSICQKFILVGDARQLAPLVQSREARDMGMNRSLFERLQKHRLALSSLNLQYRMNQKIAAISSTLFYSGKLLCINETLAKSTIQLLSTDLITNRLYSSEIDDAIVFVNTDSKSLQEAQMLSQSGSVVTNVFEAVKIDCICKKFVELGISPGDIGVICTYRKQVELVRQRISWNEIEVNTIDQYQGRDKSIIIWSLVWTDNNSGSTCELLNDERRVNVAVTRAKHKLILVGCLSSMHHVSPIMRRLIDLLAPSEILTVDSI